MVIDLNVEERSESRMSAVEIGTIDVAYNLV